MATSWPTASCRLTIALPLAPTVLTEDSGAPKLLLTSSNSPAAVTSPGTPTQPVAAGYMANAYVRMRHPDYDALHDMLDDVGRTIEVYAN